MHCKCFLIVAITTNTVIIVMFVSHNLSLKLDILSNIFQNTGYGSPPISAACVFAIIVCFFNDDGVILTMISAIDGAF